MWKNKKEITRVNLRKLVTIVINIIIIIALVFIGFYFIGDVSSRTIGGVIAVCWAFNILTGTLSRYIDSKKKELKEEDLYKIVTYLNMLTAKMTILKKQKKEKTDESTTWLN